jgi:hypothetical protein
VSSKSAEQRKIVRPTPLGVGRLGVQQIAGDVRQRLGLSPGQDLVPVVRRLGGRIQYGNFWDTEDGAIKINGVRDFEIHLPDATGAKRDRFTVAHELGHYFLHYLASGISKTGATMVAERYGNDLAETEAHWFAAELLMPQALFEGEWRRCQDAAIVAAKFDVSPVAARVRARSLSLR